MLRIDPKTTAPLDTYQYLTGAIAPRPIAFVSTMDETGVSNLAPFSFFNAISPNPLTIAFSIARRVRMNEEKDTFYNLEATKQCVVNVVSHEIVGQMAVTALNFPRGASEFEKSGLTPLASELVKPYRVAESPVQMECVVEKIIPLSDDNGVVTSQHIICRVLLMHIDENIINPLNHRIDPYKIDLVGRLGRFWYTRASGDSLFEIDRPERAVAVGYDGLPEHIRKSAVLTGNEIAHFAALEHAPTPEQVTEIKNDVRLQKALAGDNKRYNLHLLIREALKAGDKSFAERVAWWEIS